MQLLMAALNEQGYNQIKPLADRLKEVDNLQDMKRLGTLPEGVKTNTYKLQAEETRLEEQLMYAGIRLAIRKDYLYEEQQQELTAWDDLLETISRIKTDTQPLFMELGDYLIPAVRLKELYPKFVALMKSFKLNDIIANKAYFGSDIPDTVYRTALDKKLNMMGFCVIHGYSMLNIVIGD